jgi:hypothetical protein
VLKLTALDQAGPTKFLSVIIDGDEDVLDFVGDFLASRLVEMTDVVLREELVVLEVEGLALDGVGGLVEEGRF